MDGSFQGDLGMLLFEISLVILVADTAMDNIDENFAKSYNTFRVTFDLEEKDLNFVCVSKIFYLEYRRTVTGHAGGIALRHKPKKKRDWVYIVYMYISVGNTQGRRGHSTLVMSSRAHEITSLGRFWGDMR